MYVRKTRTVEERTKIKCSALSLLFCINLHSTVTTYVRYCRQTTFSLEILPIRREKTKLRYGTE